MKMELGIEIKFIFGMEITFCFFLFGIAMRVCVVTVNII